MKDEAILSRVYDEGGAWLEARGNREEMERIVKYKLAITDGTGHEHLKLEVEVHENHYRGDQELYATMLIKALDVSINLMPEADKEKWNSIFKRLLTDLEAS